MSHVLWALTMALTRGYICSCILASAVGRTHVTEKNECSVPSTHWLLHTDSLEPGYHLPST
jgi:hypothetical protein